MRLIRGGEAVPDAAGGYDPNADLAAHSNSLKVRIPLSHPPCLPWADSLPPPGAAGTRGNRIIPQQVPSGGTPPLTTGARRGGAAESVGYQCTEEYGHQARGEESVVSIGVRTACTVA